MAASRSIVAAAQGLQSPSPQNRAFFPRDTHALTSRRRGWRRASQINAHMHSFSFPLGVNGLRPPQDTALAES